MFIEATSQLDFSRKGGTFAKKTSGRDPSVVKDSEKHSHTLLELTEMCENLTHLEDSQPLQLVNIWECNHPGLTKLAIKRDGSSPSIDKYRVTACEL